jgi:hypothetical protein
MVANPQVSTRGNIALQRTRRLTAKGSAKSGDPGQDLYGASVDRSSSWKILMFSGVSFQSWESEDGRFKVIQDNLENDNIKKKGKVGEYNTGINTTPEVGPQEGTMVSPEKDEPVPVLLSSSESDDGVGGFSSDLEALENPDSPEVSSSNRREEEEDASDQEDDPPPPPPVLPDAPPPEEEVSMSMVLNTLLAMGAQLEQLIQSSFPSPIAITKGKRKKAILVEDDSDEPLETLKDKSTRGPSGFSTKKTTKPAVSLRRSIGTNESMVASLNHPLRKLPDDEPPKKKISKRERTAEKMSNEQRAFEKALSQVQVFEEARRQSMMGDKAEKKASGSNTGVPESGVWGTKAYTVYPVEPDERLRCQYQTILTILENPGRLVCYRVNSDKQSAPWDGFHMVGCAGPLSLWNGEPPSCGDLAKKSTFTSTTPYVLEEAEALSFIESFLILSGLPKVRGGDGKR